METAFIIKVGAVLFIKKGCDAYGLLYGGGAVMTAICQTKIIETE